MAETTFYTMLSTTSVKPKKEDGVRVLASVEVTLVDCTSDHFGRYGRSETASQRGVHPCPVRSALNRFRRKLTIGIVVPRGNSIILRIRATYLTLQIEFLRTFKFNLRAYFFPNNLVWSSYLLVVLTKRKIERHLEASAGIR